jgi:ribosomal protein S18 acetylase RimI-like enzyme
VIRIDERDVIVRRPTAADAPALAALQLASWNATYGPLIAERDRALWSIEERIGVWIRIVKSPREREDAWLLAEGERVTGLAWTGPSADADATPDVGELHSLHIDPSRHRRGYGTLLLDLARRDLALREFSIATLWVLEHNVGAQRFYQAQGWVPDGGRKTGPMGDAVRLPVVTELRYRDQARP